MDGAGEAYDTGLVAGDRGRRQAYYSSIPANADEEDEEQPRAAKR